MRNHFILFFIISTFSVVGQSDFLKNPVYSISFFNHSISLPGYDKIVKKPLNIGVALGVEYTYKQNPIASIHQKIELGVYRHKNLNKAIYVKTDFVNRFTSKSGPYVEYNVGIGYMLDIPEFQTFSLNDKGEFTSEKLGVRGGGLFALGVGGGYNIDINNKYVISPFVKYESMLQFPYSSILPVFPHSILHAGTRINL